MNFVKRLHSLRWTNLIVLGLILLALGLRLSPVGKMSLWTDEGLSVYRARLLLSEVLTNHIVIQDVVTDDTHPPLYFVLLHIWSRLAGEREFALRFLSVLFGVAMVPIAYVLGRQLFNREVGVWTAGLVALSPFYVWHSQDARMYSVLSVWALLSTYLIISAVRPDRRRPLRLLLGGCCSAAMALTHYTGVLIVAVQVAGVWVYLWRRQRRWALAALLLAVLLAIPTVIFVLGRLGRLEFPTFRPFQEILFETWNVFSLGPSVVQVRPWVELGIFPLIAGLGLIELLRRRRWFLVVFLTAWLFTPLIVFYLLGYIKPIYVNPRNLSIGLPAFLMCIGFGLAWLRRRVWPLAVIAALAIVILFGVSLEQQINDPRLQKDDYRSLAAYIQSQQQPADAIVLHDAISLLTFNDYYSGGLPVDAVPQYGTYDQPSRSIDALLAVAGRHDRIWFIDRPGPVGFPADLLPNWAEQHFTKIQMAGFRGSYTGAHVALYQTHSPVLDQLPAAVHPLHAASASIELLGALTPSQPAPADQLVRVPTYWRAQAPIDLTLVTELVGLHGQVWARSQEPLWRYFPTAIWPQSKVVEWDINLRLPVGLPIGQYSLRLRPIESTSGQPVQLTGADEQGYVFLGPINVDRPQRAWPREAVAEDRPAPVDFRGLSLWAYALPGDLIRPGLTFPLDLFWYADRDLAGTYRYQLEIRTPEGGVFQTLAGELSSNGFSSANWRAGDLVRLPVLVSLPPEAVGGDYGLWLTLFDPSGQVQAGQTGLWPFAQSSIHIGAIPVEEYPLQTQTPPMQITRQADFDQSIQLLGFSLSAEPYQPNSRLKVDLVWRAGQKPKANYAVLLQLIDSSGKISGQGDADPVGGLRPTGSWRPNEVIVDTHALSIGAVPPGEYTLYTGFYDRTSGQRLAVNVDGVSSPERWVKLTTISIVDR